MKRKDYQKALCDWFGVKNVRQLRKDPAWQEFAQDNGLPELRQLDDWVKAYIAAAEREAWLPKRSTESSDTDFDIEQVVSDGLNTVNEGLSGIQQLGTGLFQGLFSSNQNSSDVQPSSHEADPESTEDIETDEDDEDIEADEVDGEVTLEVVSHQGWQLTPAKPVAEELAVCTELQNHQGQSVGVLLQYSLEQSQQLKQHFQNLSLHSTQSWHQGALNTAVVDQLGAASATIASGMKMGQLFRVVGPPELVAGLSDGAYKMVQSGGSLGTVRNLANGQFVGQLRFVQASAAPILAPLIAYQVLHAIVGTQQLNQINQRLAYIERTLEELHVRQEAEVLGEIHYAITVLDDIFHERMNTGIFTTDSSNRLANVEKSILSILERNRLLVERFRDKARQAREQDGRQGAHTAATLLKADGHQVFHDMQCLVGLIAADLKLEQLLMLLAMQNNPADVGRRQERLRNKMQQHEHCVANLPSIKEIERHAKSCLKAMQWWEKLVDVGQTQRTVRETQFLNLQDVKPEFSALKPGLGGYVFWKDKEGMHIFSMSGEDLQLQPLPKAGQSQEALEVTIKRYIDPGRTYQLQLPESKSQPILVAVEEEVKPGLWLGKHLDLEQEKEVLLWHVDRAPVTV